MAYRTEDWDKMDREQKIFDEIAAQGLIDLRKATNHFMYLWEQNELGGMQIVPAALTYVLEFVQWWYSEESVLPEICQQAEQALYNAVQIDAALSPTNKIYNHQ